MRTVTLTSTLLLVVFESYAPAQSAPANSTRQTPPLYEMTIVSRTTKAINYGYLTAPTRIDFKGTPVLSNAKGEAVVEAKRGATLLKMKFENVPAPSRFGPQYLAYVVWAISPDGRAQNIGELTIDGSQKAKLSTSTPLQTFAMIVTAEPYYSVTQPSEVVVMENVVGPGTIGKIEEVNATYELFPRKPFTYDPASQQKTTTIAPTNQAQYEAINAVYQALNAIQIAQSQGADQYAPEQMARARKIYDQARGMSSDLSKEAVSLAREATQIAEDSRAIAAKRSAAEKAAIEKIGVEKTTAAPEPAPPPPPAPASVERGRASTQQPRATAGSPPIQVDESRLMRDDPQALSNRRRLLASLPKTFEVLDGGQGIVVTVPDQRIASPSLQSDLAPVAAAIKQYKDLHVEVGGHSDFANAEAATEHSAEAVKSALVGAGISPDLIAVNNYGATRPRTSNATVEGRAQNRRVEIVIAGDAIGILPTWDRTYKLQPR
jgi:outer membrane protein OmpA-like peptidoglycan-associated protein